jgi:hypothetical protein
MYLPFIPVGEEKADMTMVDFPSPTYVPRTQNSPWQYGWLGDLVNGSGAF